MSLPESITAAADRDAAFDAAAETFKEQHAFDQLFDLRMLRAKVEHGLSVGRPETLADVPKDQRPAVEAAYRDAAREVGTLLLEQNDPVRAWSYFQAIGEPVPVREAFDQFPAYPSDHPEVDYERDQERMHVALYEGAHPPKGVEMMLAMNGTCNTVTALDQTLPQMTPADRAACAEVIVRSLHADVVRAVTADIESRKPLLQPTSSLPELIAGRVELFEGGAYHVDTSHLASVVRFARSLENSSDALPLAIELCDYGRRLDRSLQYDSEPPFEDFYVAHHHFLSALHATTTGEAAAIEKAVGYFNEKLAAEPDEPDQQLIAYVLTDLLVRCERPEDAVDLAAKHLANVPSQTGFSFAELCQSTGRLNRLAEHAVSQGDLLGYLAGTYGTSSK